MTSKFTESSFDANHVCAPRTLRDDRFSTNPGRQNPLLHRICYEFLRSLTSRCIVPSRPFSPRALLLAGACPRCDSPCFRSVTPPSSANHAAVGPSKARGRNRQQHHQHDHNNNNSNKWNQHLLAPSYTSMLAVRRTAAESKPNQSQGSRVSVACTDFFCSDRTGEGLE